MITETPSLSRLVLDYGEGGSYALTGLNPAAKAGNLYKMAQSVAVFQEGTPKDVLSYIETALKKD